MNLFLSWSKDRSKSLATFLHGWLPSVIQRVEPWMSAEDIDKGQRWGKELAERLATTVEGIVCVTADNMREPWLTFEAGALSKQVGEARVRPVLLDLKPADLTGPLSQFQATSLTDRPDVFRLLTSLNKGCEKQLDPQTLATSFERAWPDFASFIERASAVTGSGHARPQRTTEDKIDEILQLARNLERNLISNTVARPRHRVIVDFSEVGPRSHHETFTSADVGTVGEWLDMVFLQMQASVPPFTYGQTWVLRDEKRDVTYWNLGRSWARQQGLMEDTRSLHQAGIPNGSTLTIKLLGPEFGSPNNAVSDAVDVAVD